MSITRFEADNYRAFPEPVSLEIRPITLVFGYNSVGKSALLRALPLLGASFGSGAGSEPLNLGSDAARGASFPDLVCKFSHSPRLRFGIQWILSDNTAERIQWTMQDLPDRFQRVITSFEIGDAAGEHITFSLVLESLDAQRPHYYRSSNYPDQQLQVAFNGLLPFSTDGSPGFEDLRQLFSRISADLSQLSHRIHWLGGLRAPIPRLEIASRSPMRIAPNGIGVGQVLYEDRIASGEILATVSAWYQSATQHRVDIEVGAFRGLDIFEVTLSPVGATPIGISFSDAGEGMSQMLPVITLLVMAKLGHLGAEPLLAIEHPELHLHPAAHVPLAGLLCSAAGARCRPKIVVETHSASLLRELQLQIVRDTLDPQSIIVYWVRSSQTGSAELQRIEFDLTGSPKGDSWPPGVFSEAAAQSRRLALARRSREAK